jgi:hypothetical protein
MSAQSEKKTLESRSFGTQGRAALRVAGRKTGENRWVRGFYRAGSVIFSSVRHVLRALWLEVTGFLFFVLAVIGGAATVREYRRHAAGTTSWGKVAVAAVFTLLFLYFGVNSFWRTRRTGKRS